MNDTNKYDDTLQLFTKASAFSSSDIHRLLSDDKSLVTVKRQLSELAKLGLLNISGAGRSVKYTISKKGLLLRPYNIATYLAKSPDERLSDTHFQFDVFEKPYVPLFTNEELESLESATEKFRLNAIHSDATSQKKELMRFIIEFSWKTSQIEGNTYDLISTENLLLYGDKSPTNTEFEAQMIINQKLALDFILENIELWDDPKISTLEMLHSYVAHNLGISKNIRRTLVGISGTNYRPLESEFQINDALNLLFENLRGANNIYEKALLAVLGVSYIQPFIDGNKRTSRLLGNAILTSQNFAPLSYRSVNDRTYKEACLIFYEQNSIEPFKKIFIEQYIFSANTYNIARPA
jgi:Fic family protein